MGKNQTDMVISVTYSFVDGAHFFTSKHPKAKGLCVASKDLAAAFNEVSYQLKTLLSKNEGIPNASCQSMVEFDILRDWIYKEIECSKSKVMDEFFVPVPTAKMTWSESKKAA